MNFEWPRSKAIHSLALKPVESVLANFSLSQFSGPVWDKAKLLADLKAAEETYRAWLAPCLNLEEYPYAYPVHGVTDAINQWLLHESRPIQRLRGDYTWPDQVRPGVQVLDSVEERSKDAVLYVSNPSAADGNYRQDWKSILGSDGAIVLDCAYIGSVMARPIQLSRAVEQIFFSFSKGFGLNRLRIGWTFSRQPQPLLDALRGVAYFPSLVPVITQVICSHWGIDYFASVLRDRQESICKRLQLNPSDSYLIGYGSADSFPDWAREKGSTARVPLASFYRQEDIVE